MSEECDLTNALLLEHLKVEALEKKLADRCTFCCGKGWALFVDTNSGWSTTGACMKCHGTGRESFKFPGINLIYSNPSAKAEEKSE